LQATACAGYKDLNSLSKVIERSVVRNASFVAEHQNFSSFCAAITEMVLQQTIINGIIDDEKNMNALIG
jgi:hypothetical protein